MKYIERQKLNVWWIWAILLLTSLFALGVITFGFLTGGDITPDGLVGAAIGLGSMVFMLVIIASMTLRTQIDEYGIEAGIKPFVNKKFFWREVESVHLDEHDNLHFGYKINPFTKTNHLTLNTGQVIVVRLRNGRTFRIGTQKPEEVDIFLRELFDTTTEYAEPIQPDLLEELDRVRIARRR